MTLHGWMSYLGQGHADTGTGRLVDRQLALFLPASHCPGSGGVLHCTARGGKALQWSLGLQCRQETCPPKFNGEQGGTGGTRGNRDTGGRSATVILHLVAFPSCPLPSMTTCTVSPQSLMIKHTYI